MEEIKKIYYDSLLSFSLWFYYIQIEKLLETMFSFL